MSFEKIIGQDVAIKAIKNMIAQDQVRGTYLFLGPDGVGKRATAISLAKAVNCEGDSRDTDCECTSCKKIDSGNHPDVFLVYPEGASYSIKIIRIREIIYEASLKPYEAKKRVFIVNDAEAMTEEAQNSFLKLLEEPPKNHILMLTSSNMAGILPTVISRCKILKFNKLAQPMIQGFLMSRDFDEDQAILYSHMAMGSIGRAIELKEMNIVSQRDEIVNNFFLSKSAIFRENVLSDSMKDDVEDTLHILLYWYRDLLVYGFTNTEEELLNIDRRNEISSYAGRFSKKKLQRDVTSILKTIELVRANVNPKSALFNMAVGLKRG